MIKKALALTSAVFLDRPTDGEPAAVGIKANEMAPVHQRPLPAGVYFANNILLTDSGLPVINIPYAIESISFQANAYYERNHQLKILWQDHTFYQLAHWAKYSGQEMLKGRQLGLDQRPMLQAAGTGSALRSIDSLAHLVAYRLSEGSPLIDTGIAASVQYGTKLERLTDFSGNGIGKQPDIGVFEYIFNTIQQ